MPSEIAAKASMIPNLEVYGVSTLEEAIKFFVNLRAKVAENEVIIKDKIVRVTVSIGISFGKGHCEVDDMLEACDSALYVAKENGRNRVEIAL